MRLELTGRHVDVTPDVRKLIEKRLTRLDRLLKGGIVSVQAVLTREKYRHTSEITVHTRGDHFLHGLGNSNAWETSITAAVEKIEQQLAKMKGKWQERKRRVTSPRVLVAEAELSAPVPPEPTKKPRIRRVPRYPVKPMTVDEAAMAVDGGSEAFLVFRNAVTDAINVLYRRKDGHFGLIEPEG